MAEKTKTNDYGDVVFTEQDAIDLLYKDPTTDIGRLFFDDTKKYNTALKDLGIDLPIIHTAPDREDLADFDNKHINDWHMPDAYNNIDVLEWLLERCQTDEERTRVRTEYTLFEKRNFVKVLQFLIYFI